MKKLSWAHCLWLKHRAMGSIKTLPDIPLLDSESPVHLQNTTSINYCSILSTVVIFSLSRALWKELSFSTDFFLVLPRKKEHPSECHSTPIFLLSMSLPFNLWAKMKYYNLFSTFLAGKNKSFLSRKVCLFRTNMFLPAWFFWMPGTLSIVCRKGNFHRG